MERCLCKFLWLNCNRVIVSLSNSCFKLVCGLHILHQKALISNFLSRCLCNNINVVQIMSTQILIKSILFHSFVVASNCILNVLANNIIIYQKDIETSTDETISIMDALTAHQPFIMSFTTLLAYWFDNI